MRVPIGELVRQLRAFPPHAFDTTQAIGEFLVRTPVEPDSLAPYLNWDGQHYSRHLIDKTELYELLAICCEPGQVSSVHNHRDQNCRMAAPAGKLVVENFRVALPDVEAGTGCLHASNSVELTAENPCAVDPRETARGVPACVFAAI